MNQDIWELLDREFWKRYRASTNHNVCRYYWHEGMKNYCCTHGGLMSNGIYIDARWCRPVKPAEKSQEKER